MFKKGGQYFVTTKTTLCKNQQSFFYKLCQDDPSVGLTTDKGKNLLIYVLIYRKTPLLIPGLYIFL